jgi:hypothetical protein
MANNNVLCIDKDGHSAVTLIEVDGPGMSIKPEEYSISTDGIASATISFYVANGSAPYKWSVASPGLGTISYQAASSHNASYKTVPGASGVNIITVTDSKGNTVSAQVNQTISN